MCISCKRKNKLKIFVDGQQVSQLRYLGSLITEDEYCMKEIRSRIGMASEESIYGEKETVYG